MVQKSVFVLFLAGLFTPSFLLAQAPPHVRGQICFVSGTVPFCKTNKTKREAEKISKSEKTCTCPNPTGGMPISGFYDQNDLYEAAHTPPKPGSAK